MSLDSRELPYTDAQIIAGYHHASAQDSTEPEALRFFKYGIAFALERMQQPKDDIANEAIFRMADMARELGYGKNVPAGDYFMALLLAAQNRSSEVFLDGKAVVTGPAVTANTRAEQVALLKAAARVPYLEENYRKLSDEIDEIACELEEHGDA